MTAKKRYTVKEMHPYQCYSREDALCQTNGFFSLNLTKHSSENLVSFLKLRDGQRVLWAGCGDGRELFVMAQRFPNVSFFGCDLNKHAIRIAQRVLTHLGLANVRVCVQDVFGCTDPYDVVYSTALAGPDYYAHVESLAQSCLYVFAEMVLDREVWETLSVTLSGSRERRQLVAINIE